MTSQVDAFASLPFYKLAPIDNYKVPQTVLDIQEKSKPSTSEAAKAEKSRQKYGIQPQSFFSCILLYPHDDCGTRVINNYDEHK